MVAAEQAEKEKAIYEQATIGFVTHNILQFVCTISCNLYFCFFIFLLA
jgi:hypothetical protein